MPNGTFIFSEQVFWSMLGECVKLMLDWSVTMKERATGHVCTSVEAIKYSPNQRCSLQINTLGTFDTVPRLFYYSFIIVLIMLL